MRTLAVVVVNLNAGAFLSECLRSVFTEPRDSKLRVTVVDNGSTDGSLELIGRGFPDVRVIKNGRNVGFAAAANIALREIRDAGEADYVLLLDAGRCLRQGAADKVFDPELLSRVFRTPVAVDHNPASGRPRVTWNASPGTRP